MNEGINPDGAGGAADRATAPAGKSSPPLVEISWPSCSCVSGLVKQMGCHTLIGFALINIRSRSAVGQRLA